MKRALVLLLMMLVVGDLLVTHVALSESVGREVNPLAIRAEHALGALWWLPKGGAGVLIAVVAYLWPSFRVLAAAIGIYMWIVATNVFLLYLV